MPQMCKNDLEGRIPESDEELLVGRRKGWEWWMMGGLSLFILYILA